MWFKMSAKSKWILIWCVFSFIFIYGPWGWNPQPGTFSWVATTLAVFMILIPLVALVIASIGAKDTSANAKQMRNDGKM